MKKFAFINKSYSKDLHYSQSLYKAWKKHYKGESPYYVICPKNDYHLFADAFSDASEVQVMVEEELAISHKLNLEEYQKLRGWESQQIIKMIAGFEMHLENYITMDSDAIFVKDFNDNIFFSNGILKTICAKKPNKGHVRKEIDDIFREGIALPKKFEFINFISAFFLWNTKVLQDLEIYIKKTNLRDFIDMIKHSPWETSWYGKFIYLFFPEKLIKFDNPTLVIYYNSSSTKTIPLVYLEFCERLNSSYLMAALQAPQEKRCEITLLEILEKYDKIKPITFVKNLIYFISILFPNKNKRHAARSKLSDFYLNYLTKK